MEIFGKAVNDLQTDVEISTEGTATGTLKYVTGYTGFSVEPELQEGNFIALKVDCPDDATVTCELKDGASSPVELDADRNIVIRIADVSTQDEIYFNVSGAHYDSKEFTVDISGLTLEENGG